MKHPPHRLGAVHRCSAEFDPTIQHAKFMWGKADRNWKSSDWGPAAGPLQLFRFCFHHFIMLETVAAVNLRLDPSAPVATTTPPKQTRPEPSPRSTHPRAAGCP